MGAREPVDGEVSELNGPAITVLGVGNAVMGDDAAGLEILRLLKARVAGGESIRYPAHHEQSHDAGEAARHAVLQADLADGHVVRSDQERGRERGQ